MPITSVNSYPATADAFSNHWNTVNTAQPSAPIVLPDGTTHADFVAMIATMNDAFDAIPAASAAARSASAALALKRVALQPRVVQFGQAIRLYLGQSRFANAAPKAPGSGAGEQIFKTSGETLLARWQEINAATDLAPFSPPLMLPTTYTAANFETEWHDLMQAFSADRLAGIAATQLRANRNALLPPIYQAMKKYRESCLLLLPKDSPLRATLPRLTPTSGTTPKPVVVSGAWDNQLGQARLTWLAATAKDVDKLQVRGCTGSTYKAADEEIIADLPADATHWEGDWGLTAPGAIASFKVYVMTTTDNENGGKAVKIVRPTT